MFSDDPLTGSTPVGGGEIPSGEIDVLWEAYEESSLHSSTPIVAAEPPVSDGAYRDVRWRRHDKRRADCSVSDVEDLLDLGLKVNWRTLLIGLEGPGKYPPRITLDEVRDFAASQLAVSDHPSEGVVALAVASHDESEDVFKILRRLTDEEESEPGNELRKWRLLLLKQAMRHLPADPLYGLLALTEFWERFDFPEDSPHIVQGRGNQAEPIDYYTEANYRQIVERHKAWLDGELVALTRYPRQ